MMSRDMAFQSQNQNLGNRISNTPSVKVHAPPGGASQFSLSWGTDPVVPTVSTGRGRVAAQHLATTTSAPPAVPMAQQQRSSSAAYAGTYRAEENIHPNAAAAPVAPAPSGAYSGVSSNVFASGSNQNSGNFLTDRRTTKVVAPPGGRSSIVFG